MNISSFFAFAFGSKFDCANDRISRALEKCGFNCIKTRNTTDRSVHKEKGQVRLNICNKCYFTLKPALNFP